MSRRGCPGGLSVPGRRVECGQVPVLVSGGGRVVDVGGRGRGRRGDDPRVRGAHPCPANAFRTSTKRPPRPRVAWRMVSSNRFPASLRAARRSASGTRGLGQARDGSNSSGYPRTSTRARGARARIAAFRSAGARGLHFSGVSSSGQGEVVVLNAPITDLSPRLSFNTRRGSTPAGRAGPCSVMKPRLPDDIGVADRRSGRSCSQVPDVRTSGGVSNQSAGPFHAELARYPRATGTSAGGLVP